MWRVCLTRFDVKASTLQRSPYCPETARGTCLANDTNPPWRSGRNATRAVETVRERGDQAGEVRHA
jgi:hypothetical protein